MCFLHFSELLDVPILCYGCSSEKLNVVVFGSFLPHCIFGRFRVVCSAIRMVYLVLAAIVTGRFLLTQQGSRLVEGHQTDLNNELTCTHIQLFKIQEIRFCGFQAIRDTMSYSTTKSPSLILCFAWSVERYGMKAQDTMLDCSA